MDACRPAARDVQFPATAYRTGAWNVMEQHGISFPGIA